MEPLTEAEIQVLITSHALKRRARDPDTAALCPPSAENLINEGQKRFEEKLQDWDEALASLTARGFLEHEGLLYILTESGAVIARQQVALAMNEGFSDELLRCEASPTHSTLCRRLYGADLCQFNMMDMSQLKRLLEVLHLGYCNSALDLGCGLGRIAEYISDQTGAHVIGVDIAAKAVARALERTEAKRSRLDFKIGDLDQLDLALGGVDTIISVDSLYFSDDLNATVSRMKELLKPDGQMGIFYSQVLWNPEWSREILKPKCTKLARALTGAGLSFVTWEYTQDEWRFWRLQKEVAEILRDGFEKEGNQDVCMSRVKESEMMLEKFESDGVRRYLYHVGRAA
jgi:SAM-dependent methyltransferase